MTTAVETHLVEASGRSWASLLAPLGGLGIVAGLILLMISPAGEDTGETPAEVVAFASAHEGWTGAFAFFALGSVLLGGGFVAGLHTRLRGVATQSESTLIRSVGSRSRCSSRSAWRSGRRRSSTCRPIRPGPSWRRRPT